MKTAIYCRVSADEQRQRQSILTQRAEVLRYCEAHDIGSPTIYADDGVSGTVPFEQRPGGAQLLKDTRAGKIHRLLVYKLDRLGRDTRVILNAIKMLEDLGVEIAATSEPYDSASPAGRFMTTIMAGQATLERENIRDRAMAGIARAVREGRWAGGIVPYGYRVEGNRREAQLVISEVAVPGTAMTESDAIRLMFRMSGDEGKSCFAIAEHLNRLGVPAAFARDGSEAPRGKRKRATSGTWRDSRVLYILTSPTYKGLHIYGKRPKNTRQSPARVERKVPAIVDPALWDRAQVTIKRNRFFCRRNARRDYLLRGLAKCGHCGWTYIGTVYSGASRPTRKYYVCGSRHKGRRANPDPSHRCYGIALPGDIEDVVWADIERFLRDPGTVLEQLARQLRSSTENTASVKSRLGALKTSLAAKDGERTKVIGLYRRGRIDDATLDQQLEEVDRERAQLQDDIQQLEGTAARAHQLEAELLTSAGILEGLRCRLNGPLTGELKRQIVEVLVKGIVVETIGQDDERDSRVTVTYRFDTPDPSIAPDTNRGIRVLQTLALPLGYAAATFLRRRELYRTRRLLAKRRGSNGTRTLGPGPTRPSVLPRLGCAGSASRA